MEKHNKNIKQKYKFEVGLLVVLLAISVSIVSFESEEYNAVGRAAEYAAQDAADVDFLSLPSYNDFESLKYLASGNYLVDDEGILYWLDDKSIPAVGIVLSFEPEQVNRPIYIDSLGRIGYKAT